MPKVVHPRGRRQPCFLEQGLPATVVNVMHTDWSSLTGRENPLRYTLRGRLHSVLFQSTYSHLTKPYGTSTTSSFRSTHYPVKDGPVYSKRPCVQVHIRPL